MMNVPAAFRKAPCIPASSVPPVPGRPAPRVCKCGAALIPTYYSIGKSYGKRATIITPVLWCVYCEAAAFARPVPGQTEVRVSTYMWKCAHCGGYMRRLHLTGNTYGGRGIPFSYCGECGSASFRPVLRRDRSPKCHMCHKDIAHDGRWCRDCSTPVGNWVRWNGSIPLPDEEGFEETIREVREYAAKMGYSWKAGRRVCLSCQKEFVRGKTRQRRCVDCLAERKRERELQRERARLGRAGARRAARVEAKAKAGTSTGTEAGTAK